MTKTRIFLNVIMIAVIATVFSSLAPAAGGATKPNVILVFIDDMGWADFSCFGNKDAQTPNVDRMATEGIAFEQFYVNSPICSPSRVAISTGQYPQRWRITSFLASRRYNKQPRGGELARPKSAHAGAKS